MFPLFWSMVTIFCYLAALFLMLAFPQRTVFGIPSHPGVLWMSSAGSALHLVLLTGDLWIYGLLNIAWNHLISWSIWLALLWFIFSSFSRPRIELGIFLLPLAIASVALLLLPATRPIFIFTPIQLHIFLSIFAYTILLLAALQALALAWLHTALRRKTPLTWLQRLPPLQRMEKGLFQFVALAFFLLTLSLLSGFMFLPQEAFARFLPKMLLSAITWFILLGLLFGRQFFGWRGQSAVSWVFIGLIFLMMTFLASQSLIAQVREEPALTKHSALTQIPVPRLIRGQSFG